jgi:hypothetical protein
MPRTIKRSPEKAQRTYEDTLDHAEKTYGRGETARPVAYSAPKHSFEQVGDHWEPEEKKGASDPDRAAGDQIPEIARPRVRSRPDECALRHVNGRYRPVRPSTRLVTTVH